MDGASLDIWARLPIAEGVFTALRYLCQDEFLQDVFEEFRGRSYKREIPFQEMVRLMLNALCEHQGSLHQTIVREDNLVASEQAIYGKLRRMPLSLSQGLLLHGAARIVELRPLTLESPLPKSFATCQAINIDGKKIKNVAKRLKETRTLGNGKLIGGKCLVAHDINSGMILAMNSSRDGETNDPPLVNGLLEQLLLKRDGKRLVCVMDSQFCDLTQPLKLQMNNCDFIVRHHPKVRYFPDESVPIKHGVDTNGRAYEEDWGWLGDPKSPKSLKVRRITVHRADIADLASVPK